MKKKLAKEIDEHQIARPNFGSYQLQEMEVCCNEWGYNNTGNYEGADWSASSVSMKCKIEWPLFKFGCFLIDVG
jgi:hypothetical protein